MSSVEQSTDVLKGARRKARHRRKEDAIMKNTESNMTAAANAMKNSGRAVHAASRSVAATGRAAGELNRLNTMRGGTKGFKGFVGESMEAREASALGRRTDVLGNNGIADLRWTKTDGTEALRQMKIGYGSKKIDFARYKGQTVVIDKGNPNFAALKAEGASCGVKVVEGHITASEAKHLADAMQFETRLTGNKHAVVVPKVYQGVKNAAAVHSVGVNAAKHGAISGAGFSLGSNLVEVAKGKKTVGEAAGDVVCDTAVAGAVSYGTGIAAGVVASTETGAALLGAAGAVGTAVAEAPDIGTVVGASSTAAGAVAAAATTAATTMASAATSAAAGTAAAGLVAAAAPLAVAAAPVLVGGAIIGGLYSLFSD